MGLERLRATPEGARGAHRALQVRLRHRTEFAPHHPEGGRIARRGGTRRGAQAGRSRDAADHRVDGKLSEATHRGPAPAVGAGRAHAGRERRRHPLAQPGRDLEQARGRAAAAPRADGAAFRRRHADESGRSGRTGHRPAGCGPPAESNEAALLRLRILGVAGARPVLLGHPDRPMGGQAQEGKGRVRGAGSSSGGRIPATLGHGRGAGHRGWSRISAGRRPGTRTRRWRAPGAIPVGCDRAGATPGSPAGGGPRIPGRGVSIPGGTPEGAGREGTPDAG